MILNRLMEIRANEALVKEAPVSDFSKMFKNNKGKVNNNSNPFGNMGSNPFRGRGRDSFY